MDITIVCGKETLKSSASFEAGEPLPSVGDVLTFDPPPVKQSPQPQPQNVSKGKPKAAAMKKGKELKGEIAKSEYREPRRYRVESRTLLYDAAGKLKSVQVECVAEPRIRTERFGDTGLDFITLSKGGDDKKP